MRSIRDVLSQPSLWSPLLGAAVASSALAGACTIPRERPAGGVHPEGFADEASADFHGLELKKHGYPLADCRVCHGEDYAGGAVGKSCLGTCHEKGVEACGTCHGKGENPLPDSGAHGKHAAFCGDCHTIPEDARSAWHPNGAVEIVFSGLAAKNPDVAYLRSAQRCANVYCHGGNEIGWEPPAPDLGCDGCHGAPPESHTRWKVDAAPTGCAPCHPIPSDKPDSLHVDGKLDVLPLGCDGCHGQGPLGLPPPSLQGAFDPTNPGVGAHLRHVDDTLANRIGKAASCETCHPVPASVETPGHLDISAPADVTLPFDGTYDATTQRCVTSCHWDRDPGPSWTDVSGAPKQCDACHGFPPKTTRKGTAHPPAADLAACLSCHIFEPTRHVDGHVDFTP